MRIEQRQAKNQERVEIPGNLTLFLKEVHREIVEGEEVTTIESDDLIQYEEFDCAYGGLLDAETNEFSFRYFTDNENESIWDFNLSKSEIEKIFNGKIKHLTLWACKHPVCGCKHPQEDSSCFNCDWIEQPII